VTTSGRDLDATRLATALADGEEGAAAAALDGADNALRMAVRELGYATALAKRYRRDAGNIRADHEAYTAAMRSHAARFPDDSDAATLYSAALMNLTPWKWWVKGEPSAAISEALAVLRRVLERDPLHLGANHYLIHATEESPNPEDALPSARRLAALAPAAGHILHMPSHIYRRTGQHAEATAANYTAVAVDRAYIRQTPATDRYPLHYLSHNLHFLTASLSIEGRESEAIAAAMDLLENALAYSGGYNEKHNQTLAKTKDDYFFTVPILTAARFNRWRSLQDVEEKIINQRSTSIHPELHFTRAMLAYAGGLQYLAGGSVSESGVRRWIETLAAAVHAAPKDLTYGTNQASDLFEIAAWVLVARSQEAIRSNIQDLISDLALPIDLSLLGGDRNTISIRAWEQAVKREDRLDYDEPSDWYYPVRESLGAAHYRRGNFSAAEAVFRKDLEINRGNGRSLFGLIESLRAQGKPVPERLTLQYREAWRNATVKLSLETM
jgi:tetratricopeptide (TPR) repeat protein